MNKVRVDIEEVRQLKARLREINQIPFENIEWHKNNEPVPISDKAKEDFKFIGLNNTDFITMELYREPNLVPA